MKKSLFLLCILNGFISLSFGQVKWTNDSSSFSDIQWNNYSTTYIGEGFDTIPTILVAIPYDGIFDMADEKAGRSEIDLSSPSSAFRLRSNLSHPKQLYTYDSSDVFFLTPGIFANNSSKYEYRVMLNGQQPIKPWSKIDKFTDSAFQINDLKRSFGFLGGYKTTWGNFLSVELRKTGSQRTLATALVRWKQISPSLLNIFTAKDLSEFLLKRKLPYDLSISQAQIKEWKERYTRDGLDPQTFMPRKFVLQANEDDIIFFVTANIYKKEALEYKVTRNGVTFTDWKENDNDNNSVWIKNLPPGDYKIELRYRAQRQNVTEYDFYKRPFWYQTLLFKVISIIVVIGFLASFLLLVVLSRQKVRIAATNKRRADIENKLEYIRSQLNPHFIFNSLSSIQGLINSNKIEEANYYLHEFSSLLRETLVSNDKQSIPLRIELTILRRYIKLEQLRFDFDYTIIVDSAIDQDMVMFPSLLLQPLIENAIKHGISSLQKNGFLKIQFLKSNNDLLIDIIDNGAGFDPVAISQGMGLKLTNERIRLVNESVNGSSISLVIENSSSTGVVAHLKLVNWL